ncbi:hypothetical protein DSO57_1037764 [Entomophthora muscae]|uniref:Uncharacterized protein n=1 Tax=Entomophthora muscae TaxID=34485 RepID=A0ACC2TA29_9FUNG|nr:hypothetical protein DSO57_1037764 [Entomophthora muscae]
MTLPLTSRPDRPMETPTAAETTSTQLFGVLYITLAGLVDSMVPTSGPGSLLGRSMSYIIKLAPILWWALPAGSAQPHPEFPDASIYAWFPDNRCRDGRFKGQGVFCTEPFGGMDPAALKVEDLNVGIDVCAFGSAPSFFLACISICIFLSIWVSFLRPILLC